MRHNCEVINSTNIASLYMYIHTAIKYPFIIPINREVDKSTNGSQLR